MFLADKLLSFCNGFQSPNIVLFLYRLFVFSPWNLYLAYKECKDRIIGSYSWRTSGIITGFDHKHLRKFMAVSQNFTWGHDLLFALQHIHLFLLHLIDVLYLIYLKQIQSVLLPYENKQKFWKPLIKPSFLFYRWHSYCFEYLSNFPKLMFWFRINSQSLTWWDFCFLLNNCLYNISINPKDLHPCSSSSRIPCFCWAFVTKNYQTDSCDNT